MPAMGLRRCASAADRASPPSSSASSVDDHRVTPTIRISLRTEATAPDRGRALFDLRPRSPSTPIEGKESRGRDSPLDVLHPEAADRAAMGLEILRPRERRRPRQPNLEAWPAKELGRVRRLAEPRLALL